MGETKYGMMFNSRDVCRRRQWDHNKYGATGDQPSFCAATLADQQWSARETVGA